MHVLEAGADAEQGCLAGRGAAMGSQAEAQVLPVGGGAGRGGVTLTQPGPSCSLGQGSLLGSVLPGTAPQRLPHSHCSAPFLHPWGEP